MNERLLEIADLPTTVIEAGSGGRPLLLVHGFGGAKEDFGDHLDALADAGWWAVAPDLRGHGGAIRPTGAHDYSLEIYGADIWQIVNGLGWDQLVLLGHSMGGMAAQYAAIAQPDRLHGLILMDTSASAPVDIDLATAQLGAEIARNQGMAVLKEILDGLGEDAPLGNAAFDRMVKERPGYQDFSDNKLLTASPDMYASMLVQFPVAEGRLEAMAELTMPTLVLVGELDATFRRPAEALASTMLNAELRVLDGGGHSPQFEAAELWIAAMLEFLADL